jgi:hypothetical protein
MSEVQLNVRLPKALRQRVREEVARHNTTHEIVLSAIIEDFFKSWSVEERAKFYRGRGRPYGRTA